MDFSTIINSPYFIVLIYISVLLKGVALWRAGTQRQRNWFIALLVINLVGILELVYLFKFSKKPLTLGEIKSWVKRDS